MWLKENGQCTLPGCQIWFNFKLQPPDSRGGEPGLYMLGEHEEAVTLRYYFFATIGGSINLLSFSCKVRMTIEISPQSVCVMWPWGNDRRHSRGSQRPADGPEDEHWAFDSLWGVWTAQEGALWRQAVHSLPHTHIHYPGSLCEYKLWTSYNITTVSSILKTDTLAISLQHWSTGMISLFQ